MLNANEIELIEMSFKILQKNESTFAENFYNRLFDLAPIIKPLFKTDRTLLKKHFFAIITSAVTNIHNFDSLKPTLLELGSKHRIFGAKKEHFSVVKTAMILAIAYELKGSINLSIEQAWSNYFDMIAEVMIEGLLS